MSRAVFIASGGDPFLALFMLKLFERWQNEVDKLYICYNGQQDKKVVEFVRSQYAKNPKCHFIYIKEPLGFGEPINRCLKECNEDLVLLLEDDGFIYQSGIVDEMFKKIEGGGVDIIGSPRFSCTDGIAEATRVKYGLDYSGDGDKGPNWWPNFLFCKRSDLLKTDLNFAAKGWKRGDYIKELDLTCQSDECGDTSVWMCIQLRAMGLKFLDVGQRHAMPSEIEDQKNGTFNYKHGYFGWIHGGSLSSGWDGFLAGKYTAEPPNDYCLQELESRVAFWKIVGELDHSEELKEFRQNYLIGIGKMINHYQMNRGRINSKIKIWKELMSI